MQRGQVSTPHNGNVPMAQQQQVHRNAQYQNTPAPAMARRPGQPPTQQQMQQQQMNVNNQQQQVSRHQHNMKRKRKFGEKTLNESIVKVIPDGQSYMDLLAYEQKFDSLFMKKRAEIQESLKRMTKVKRKLRIFISHNFVEGNDPEKESETGTPPFWELRVEGRLIEDEKFAEKPFNKLQAVNVPKKKFSSFFKSLIIELDTQIYGPDNHLVEWHRNATTNETDGFQVKRPGDREVSCKIYLTLEHLPVKYKIHPRLSKLLGIPMETRQKIVEHMYHYIKTNNLQDPNNRDTINCDEYLEQLFGVKSLKTVELPGKLTPFLSPTDPIILTHTITKHEKNTQVVDIDVELPDPTKSMASLFLQNTTNQQEINTLDDRIAEFIETLNEVKLRRDFFLRFSDNPKNLIDKWLVSQSKDLNVLKDDGLYNDLQVDETAEAYYNPQLCEGINRYVYNKVLQKRAELEQTLGVKNN
uniref:SWIB domain-containing protein n=1 Tax=Rhabditophanes sp. KR3021 TaxID=114890 RepID=A0AC35TT11_9BILA